jgi:protein involved in polysaccharide export with SLBB domain
LKAYHACICAIGLSLCVISGGALAQEGLPNYLSNPFIEQLSQPVPQAGQNPVAGTATQTVLEIPEYTPGASLAGPDYVVGPGDQFVVYIKSLQDSSFYINVSPEGKIFLPMVGEVKVNGLTVGNVQELLKFEFSKYLKDFQISIALNRLRTITVEVLGEVVRPGIYKVSAIDRVSVALGLAGGPNQQASIRAIQLIRKGDTVAVLDLYKYFRKNDQAQNPLLEFGDIIFMPISSNFLRIAGQVKYPGRYEVKEGERLLDMIAMAGGLTPTASFEKFKITNIASPDKVTSIDVKQLMLDKNEELNVSLKPGDIITIPSMPVSVTIVGQVQKPGTFMHEPGTLVSYYLGLAGGYGERANTRNIKINRWGGKTIKAKENTIVEPGDVIVVGGMEIKGWRDYLSVMGQAATLFFIVWQVAK